MAYKIRTVKGSDLYNNFIQAKYYGDIKYRNYIVKSFVDAIRQNNAGVVVYINGHLINSIVTLIFNKIQVLLLPAHRTHGNYKKLNKQERKTTTQIILPQQTQRAVAYANSVLIIDDISVSGNTIAQTKQAIKKINSRAKISSFTYLQI